MHLNKNHSRQRYKDIISNYTEDERLYKSHLIQNNLRDLLDCQKSGTWAGFQPLPTEPFINFSDLKNMDWVFPKVSGNEIHFYKSDTFQVFNWGISEPVNGSKIALKNIDGVCVPALAFGQTGRRLGRGKGYYDKTLSDYKGLKIGISYDDCVSDQVPFEDHDLCVDYIVTEKNIVNIRGVN